EIGREQRPGGDNLGQFFVSECHRLTIGVIGPLAGFFFGSIGLPSPGWTGRRGIRWMYDETSRRRCGTR
ncbi:MAG TPA: hypothetical protein DIC23_18030, partial [Planctomycetaceae bacterium]|nr:hypothetical protein [Planctomycetaceae bacterium]